MYPVSDRFLDTISGSHRAVSKARLLTTTQFGANPQGVELPILSGDVRLSATADVKSTLELTVPGDFWATAQPYGAEVWAARGVVFGDGTEELVPLGYFRIDTIEQEDAPYGPVRLSCSDRIAQIKQNRVLYPFQVPTGYTHRRLFERLVNGRLSVGDAATPEQTKAAQLIRDRFVLGQEISEDWTWTGAPAIVGTYRAALRALYEVAGGMPAETRAALYIDDRILCHASIESDWSWAGMPSVVATYNDELMALYIAAGSPEATTWLQTYITAHGGTMPTQTRTATIIQARLESGLTINADWTWPDPPQIVTQYAASIKAQYPGAYNDRPTAITWLQTYINSHGGAADTDPVSWLETYIAANGGYDTINSLGYAALIQGPAIPIVWAGYDPDRYTIDGGPVVENSSYEFMAKLADARECVMRFDELGQLVIEKRDVDIDAAPDYVIEPGRTGNLIKASRKTDRDGYYNIVVAYGSNPASPTGYQLAYNNQSNSPLRWDSQFGAAPRYYASPLLRTPQEAADAAATILSRYTGLPTTLGLWTVPNPAIRPQDVVAAKIAGLAETHTVDVVTIPLAIAGGGPVEIATKTLNEVLIPETAEDPGAGSTAPTPAQILQEKCFQLTSTAENSTVQWWTQFGYIEDIGDTRGYTAGIAGFTSATGDLLEVVQNYASVKPGNVLAPFIPGLTVCANAGMGGTASALAASNLGTPFINAWRAAADDVVFQTVQRNYRDQVYWVPAFNAAVADGVGALGLALYYDTSINHGPGVAGSGDGSFDAIRAATTGTRPSSGGSETTWLTNWLTARAAVLTAWGDNPPDGRIAMFTALLGTGNLTLTVPITWSVYGDSYTMTTDPLPFGFTPGGGGGTGSGSTAWPNPGVAHNIGSQPGQNSFNIGIGFDGHPTYGTKHRDFTRAEIEAGLSIPGYYELTPAGDVLMSAHPGGGRTTSNTDYARTEYRGLERDGVTKMAFNPSDGRHYIKGRSAIDGSMAAAKPETVLAQYHDASDDTAMIHVQGGLVRAKIRGAYVATLEAAWDHTPKDWMLEVTDGGKVNFYWGNMTTPAYSNNSFVGATSGWYEKAGDYMQWNLSNGDATICRVRLISLEHWHSKTPKSSTPWPTPARPAIGGGSTGSGGGTGTGSTGGASNTDDGVEAAKLLGWGAVVAGDEFAYTGAPASKWGLYDGPGHDGNGTRDPEAWNVANGMVTCTGTANGSTGGMALNYSEKYCRVEARVRTYSINPKGSGARYHPVLIYWPTSDQWPQGGEFDFYECDCDSGLYEAYLHIPGNDGGAQEYVKKTCDISQWHNIAFEWRSNGITGWLDGQQVFNFPGFKNPPGPMHFTMQLDNFHGSSGMEPAKFDCQWVRIYNRPS